MVVLLNRQTGICVHCGRDDVGIGSAGYGAVNGELLCHPHVTGRPDCFRLVIVYGHPHDCRCEGQYPVAGTGRGLSGRERRPT